VGVFLFPLDRLEPNGSREPLLAALPCREDSVYGVSAKPQRVHQKNQQDKLADFFIQAQRLGM
jgi:hypothetical protein